MLNKSHKRVSIKVAPLISLELITQSSERYNFVFNPYHPTEKVRITRFTNNGTFSKRLAIPGFTEKQYIEQIVHVFFHDKGALLWFWFSRNRNIENISKLLNGIKIVTLKIQASKIERGQLLKLDPSVEHLMISGNLICKSVLAQNFDSLQIQKVTLTLDDLLLSNCPMLFIFRQHFPDKDLNIFMKQWINGSNPHLQSISIHFLDPNRLFEISSLFRGIDYLYYIFTTNQGSEEKRFKIERHDGKKAIISIITNPQRERFNFK